MIHLRVIGESSIEIGETKIGPDSELLFSLLLYLIAERGRPVPRERLIEFFWPRVESKKARHCLRQAIYALRTRKVPIEVRGRGLFLPTDVAATDYEAASVGEAPSNASALTEVLLGYSALQTTPDFRRWLEEFRGKVFRMIATRALEALGLAQAQGEWQRAGALAEICLAVDPLNERATLARAEAAALSGNRHAALKVLDEYLSEMGADEDLRLQAATVRRRIARRVREVEGASSTELVGRSEQTAWLRMAAAQARGGHGLTLYLHGPAGIGKTRVVTALAEHLALEGTRHIRIACHSNAGGRPLGMLTRLIPELLEQPGALGCSPTGLGLLRRVYAQTADGDDIAKSFPDPQLLFAALCSSLRDLLDSIASEKPLVLVLEDVHWLDPLSEEIIAEVASSNSERALLLVMTSRTALAARLAHAIDFRQLQTCALPPLSDADARTYVACVCRNHGIAMSAASLDTVVRLGCGNPFFLGELVTHWRSSRDLSRLPGSVEAVLAVRLRDLSEAALRTLQLLALICRPVALEVIEGALRFESWNLLSCLDELQQAELIATAHGCWELKHDLLAAAALRGLEPGTRQLLHRRIAEQVYANSARGNDAHSLFEAATHWHSAGDAEMARRLAIECAQHLVSVGLPNEAASVIKSSILFAQSSRQRLELYALRSRYLVRAGDLRGGARNADEALADDELGACQEHCGAEVELYRSWLAALLVPPPAVVGRATRCANDALASDSHRLAAAVHTLTAILADPPFDRALQLRELVETIAAPTPEDQIEKEMFRLIFETELGDPEAARQSGDRVLELSVASDSSEIDRALRISAIPYRLLGQPEKALERLQEALRIGETSNSLGSLLNTYSSLVWIYFDLGDDDQAWALYERASEIAGRLPSADRTLLDLTGATVAVRRGKGSDSLRIISTIEAGQSVITVRLARQAIELGAMTLLGRAPSSRMIARAARNVEDCFVRPFMDTPVGAVCAALEMRGNTVAAEDFATSYLAKRRGKLPIVDGALRRAIGLKGGLALGSARNASSRSQCYDLPAPL